MNLKYLLCSLATLALVASCVVAAEGEKPTKESAKKPEMAAESVEESTVSPIADMAMFVDELKTSTERPPTSHIAIDEMKPEEKKPQEKPQSQRHTVADFIIHPLIAFKPRTPDDAETGKQADGGATTASTTASPWQLFGFNAGQGLSSSMSSLAGSVTGWLNDRIQLPGLVDTPVRESTTTSTTTTTTPRPDIVVRVQQRASTRRPLISINNNNNNNRGHKNNNNNRRRNRNRPNRFPISSEEDEDDFADDDDDDFGYDEDDDDDFRPNRYSNEDEEEDEDDDDVDEDDQEDDVDSEEDDNRIRNGGDHDDDDDNEGEEDEGQADASEEEDDSESEEVVQRPNNRRRPAQSQRRGQQQNQRQQLKKQRGQQNNRRQLQKNQQQKNQQQKKQNQQKKKQNQQMNENQQMNGQKNGNQQKKENQQKKQQQKQQKKQQQKKQQHQQEQNDSEAYDDDEENADQSDEFYYGRRSTKRSQSNQAGLIQRGQQSLINQIRQLTRGQTPAELAAAMRKTPQPEGQRRRGTLLVNRNGQTVYVAPELLTAAQFQGQNTKTKYESPAIPVQFRPQQATATQKRRKKPSAYPQPPLTIPLRRKGRPTQYITIPWSQLGIAPPDNLAGVTEGLQAQPLILNIPQSAINQMQKPVHRRKRPVVSPDAVPLLADASLMDIFKPPRIPPSRTSASTTRKPSHSTHGHAPVLIASKTKPSSSGGSLIPQRIRPGTIVEMAPALDSVEKPAESDEIDAQTHGQAPAEEPGEEANAEKEFIIVGHDEEPGLTRHVQPVYGDARYFSIAGRRHYRGRFAGRRSLDAESQPAFGAPAVEQHIPVQVITGEEEQVEPEQQPAKAEAEPMVETEAEAEAKPEAESEAKQEAEPEAQAEADVEVAVSPSIAPMSQDAEVAAMPEGPQQDPTA